jgi:hypothetical protein
MGQSPAGVFDVCAQSVVHPAKIIVATERIGPDLLLSAQYINRQSLVKHPIQVNCDNLNGAKVA